MLIKMFWMVVVVVLVGGGDVWGQTDREQALEDAVANCDMALVKLLLDAGADPNVHNPYGTTVLERAVANCDRALVKLLLDAGADPTGQGPAHTAILGIPGNGETLSGIGVISGWKCEAAGDITIRINDGDPIPATYGLPRADTSNACDDDGNNGFFSYTNWGNLGDGEHTVVVYDNGVEFGRSTFTVVTTGEAFLVGASKRVTVKDFPEPGETTILEWNQSTQHFEMVAVMSQAPADLGMCTEGLTVRPRQSCTGTILAFNYTFSVNASGEGCLSGTPLDGCWSEPALLPAEASDLGVDVSKNDDGSWTITGLP